MTNRFVSFLEKVGHDFKKGLDPVLHIAATAGEAAVTIFCPALGPIFAQTVTAALMAEQSATAIGQQKGTGPQKLAMVAQLVGPLIKQSLADLGKSNDDAAVDKYISAVVTILNAVPADALLPSEDTFVKTVVPQPVIQAAPLPGPTAAPVVESAGPGVATASSPFLSK